MSVQLQLPIAKPPEQGFSLNGMVRDTLLRHDWLSPYEIQRFIEAQTGVWHSDSAITARLRDLRKAQYGAHVIIKRKREGSRSYEYRLEA